MIFRYYMHSNVSNGSNLQLHNIVSHEEENIVINIINNKSLSNKIINSTPKHTHTHIITCTPKHTHTHNNMHTKAYTHKYSHRQILMTKYTLYLLQIVFENLNIIRFKIPEKHGMCGLLKANLNIIALCQYTTIYSIYYITLCIYHLCFL